MKVGAFGCKVSATWRRRAVAQQQLRPIILLLLLALYVVLLLLLLRCSALFWRPGQVVRRVSKYQRTTKCGRSVDLPINRSFELGYYTFDDFRLFEEFDIITEARQVVDRECAGVCWRCLPPAMTPRSMRRGRRLPPSPSTLQTKLVFSVVSVVAHRRAKAFHFFSFFKQHSTVPCSKSSAPKIFSSRSMNSLIHLFIHC